MSKQSEFNNLLIPPQSDEAEQSVIGGLLLDKKAFELISGIVGEKDFYRADHQLIFKAITHLESANRPYDVVTISEFLKSKNRLGEAGGMGYIGKIAKDTPSAANIIAYANIVREKSILRKMIEVSHEIQRDAYKPEGRDCKDLLDSAGQRIHDIAELNNHINTGPKSSANIITQVINDLDDRQANRGDITGISTGFTDLDNKISGLHRGDLIVVAGRPSMGKTTFAMNIAEEVAFNCKGVLIFSMEMSSKSIVERQVSSLSKLDFQKFRSGTLTESEYQQITQATARLNKYPYYIDDSAALTVNEIRTRTRKMHREHDIDLVVVDYLQLMKGEGENRTQEITKISQGLKALAKEMNIPVIALSQLNRNLESRPNKRPIMSDIRDSGAIEQDADLIMFLYRDEIYNDDSPLKGLAEVIVAKQRNGPIGSIFLTFLGSILKFDNYDGTIPQSHSEPMRKYSGGFDYEKINH